MNQKIEINSIVVNKLKNSHDDFIKYDIDVALDEVESDESSTKIKYKIALLSNPTNAKMMIEGLVSLFGNESDISKQLMPDQKNIPMIVNVIYQEIFPLIYILSKSFEISCPSYKLTQMSTIAPVEKKSEDKPVESITPDNDVDLEETTSEKMGSSHESTDELVIQEQNVRSI